MPSAIALNAHNMHSKNIIYAGKELKTAKKALILLHGRGATAEDILSLANHLNVKDFALVAPQATNYTWYPYSFLSVPKQNEPWLSSALRLIGEVVVDINENGIADSNIFFVGFSQGACLTLEFITRNARQWGGAVAFTGGLIGDKVYMENYQGDFANTPVFIGSSDPDPHVPVERVNETVSVIKQMNAALMNKIYKNIGHTVTPEEIAVANAHVFNR
jgi:phospholipase/carboxylesterase